MKWESLQLGTAPVCQNSVYLTSPHVTRSSPPYLHTASDRILEVRTAWEQD